MTLTRRNVMACVASLLLCGCGYISDAQKTVFDQTKASAVLKKYEWFKDAAAQLESFDATIKVQQKRLDFLESDRANWTRDDRQNWNQISNEIAGIKAGYNNLAAQYNSNMEKVNFRFANYNGDTLPRQFTTYKDN